MIVGVPCEVKQDEYRVAMLPVGVEELKRAGHRVLVQSGAGIGSGIPDEQYAYPGSRLRLAADLAEHRGPREEARAAELVHELALEWKDLER